MHDFDPMILDAQIANFPPDKMINDSRPQQYIEAQSVQIPCSFRLLFVLRQESS